jgi:hypothetical protein
MSDNYEDFDSLFSNSNSNSGSGSLTSEDVQRIAGDVFCLRLRSSPTGGNTSTFTTERLQLAA